MNDRCGDYLLGDTVVSDTFTITRRARRSAVDRGFLLKMLKPGVELSDTHRERLEREREALQRVSHPVVAALVDSFSLDGRPVLVFLDAGGVRLDSIGKRAGALDYRAALAIVVEVARALRACHRAKLSHGGLRAEVIELSPDGAVCLHEFGARPLEGDTGIDVPHQLALAPEQILGNVATPQSDLFLLGMVLYRLLAGEEPFQSTREGGLAHRIRHESMPTLASHGVDVPVAVERLCRRCLQKRPRDRFPDATSFIRAALRVLRAATTLPTEWWITHARAQAGFGEEPAPLRDRDQGAGGRWWDAWLRRRLWLAAAAALVAGAAVMMWRAWADDPRGGSSGVHGIAQHPAKVRVLARPWAEVHVNGVHLETTPLARAIEVRPGRHVVVFKHPNAPDVTRHLELIAGQEVVLDVEMQVERPRRSKSRDAGAGGQSL